MVNLDISGALTSIWDVINKANKYIEESAPWKMAKEKDTQGLSTCIYTILETLRIMSLLIFPFMPKVGMEIWRQLNMKKPLSTVDIKESRKWGVIAPGIEIRKAKPLFPRIVEKGGCDPDVSSGPEGGAP